MQISRLQVEPVRVSPLYSSRPMVSGRELFRWTQLLDWDPASLKVDPAPGNPERGLA